MPNVAVAPDYRELDRRLLENSIDVFPQVKDVDALCCELEFEGRKHNLQIFD